MTYIFVDTDAFVYRVAHVTDTSQLAAQCTLPVGAWSCIFKDDDGIIYNANTDNTWSRIN